MAHYTAYYDDQVGGRIDRVYFGAASQRGHGIGSFLGSLYRAVLPLFKSGIKAIGKETLRSGFNILDDVSNKNVNFREALRNRSNETADNLKRKAMDKIDRMMMSGSGYKKRRTSKRNQSSGSSSRERTKRVIKKRKTLRKKQISKIKKKTNKNRLAYDIFHS